MNVLCRDCKHCLPQHHFQASEFGGASWVTYSEARCALTDLVTGSGSAGRLCSEERANLSFAGNNCGSPGRNFEAAPVREPVRIVKAASKRRWWHL